MLLEKEIEKIIFSGCESDIIEMVGRGFYCPMERPQFFKQVSLGIYGRPDLVCFGIHQNTGRPHVIIYELKRERVGSINLEQLTRYMSGIRHWMMASGVCLEDSSDLNSSVTGVLVGTSTDDTFAGFLGPGIRFLEASYKPFKGVFFEDSSDNFSYMGMEAPALERKPDQLFPEDVIISTPKRYVPGPAYRPAFKTTSQANGINPVEDLRILEDIFTACNEKLKIIDLDANPLMGNLPANCHGVIRTIKGVRLTCLNSEALFKIFPGISATRVCLAARNYGALSSGNVSGKSRNQKMVRLKSRVGMWFYCFDMNLIFSTLNIGSYSRDNSPVSDKDSAIQNSAAMNIGAEREKWSQRHA